MIGQILNKASYNAIRQLVDNARNIVITCHLSPDGDAVGSTLALCRVLRHMGKYATVVTPDMVPRSLHFVPMVKDITAFTMNEARARSLVSQCDLIFCLDFNSLHRIDRLGEVFMQSSAPRILLDHHLNPENLFDVVVSYPELSSTCEVVYRVINEMGWRRFMDKLTAQYIYLGMMTDTGNFTYSSDYPEVYEILADLVSFNIDKQRIYNLAMNTFSADCLRIQGYALAEKMQLFIEDGAALITLNREELDRFNYKRGDTEGLVNKPLAIPGIQWVVFLREDPDVIKVSCRSEGDFSVSDICSRYFHGGGHKNAAGGELHCTMDEAVDEFKKVLDDIKR
ncbi:MAG: bifunctional oligoribonuclease/PAP phosphatase NrnA [Muribaculaceae bacterium]|nr:bifunctional oligoribonuclease/PAP phosphatase NrnA [Muribaculaceae bacterium]